MDIIYESTTEESELIDKKLVEFNRKKVPFEQSEDGSIPLFIISADDDICTS
jgi:hypothetical protein